MGLSRTVSEIDDNVGRKSQKYLTPLYFVSPLKGFPLELGTSALGQKNGMMGLPGRERRVTISLAIRVQSTNVTDGQRATAKIALTHSINDNDFIKYYSPQAK